MKRICPICKNEYEDGGDSWKKKCFDCYKTWKYDKRIQSLTTLAGSRNEIYFTHPSVTKEELDQWIKKNNKPSGWGVEKVEDGAPGWKKFTIWMDNTNFD